MNDDELPVVQPPPALGTQAAYRLLRRLIPRPRRISQPAARHVDRYFALIRVKYRSHRGEGRET